CEGLVDFWDKVLSHTSENKKHSQQGDTTVGLSLYMALADVKKILQTHLGDTKLVKKTVDGLFKRMQKHLKHNELLQQSMWRKITDYFMKRFKKVKLELERAYRVNDLMPVKEEEVYDLFEKKNLEAFKINFDETSSVGSSSIGASSVASSAITGITRTTTKTGNKFLGKDYNKEQGSHAHSSLGYGSSAHTRDSPSLSSKESGLIQIVDKIPLVFIPCACELFYFIFFCDSIRQYIDYFFFVGGEKKKDSPITKSPNTQIIFNLCCPKANKLSFLDPLGYAESFEDF
ncbi:hypothetical protein RFI_17286, partial [Reticulomyxa filosa]